MEKDFNNYSPYNMDFNSNVGGMGMEMNNMYEPINPTTQYEQSCAYYKYLCMQMDYKIKCKEYESMCKRDCAVNNNNTTTPVINNTVNKKEIR